LNELYASDKDAQMYTDIENYEKQMKNLEHTLLSKTKDVDKKKKVKNIVRTT